MKSKYKVELYKAIITGVFSVCAAFVGGIFIGENRTETNVGKDLNQYFGDYYENSGDFNDTFSKVYDRIEELESNNENSNEKVDALEAAKEPVEDERQTPETEKREDSTPDPSNEVVSKNLLEMNTFSTDVGGLDIFKDRALKDNHENEYYGGIGLGQYSGKANTYALNGKYERFKGILFLDFYHSSTTAKGSIKIYGDDKLLHQTEPMTKESDPQEIDILIEGVKKLKIVYEGDSLNKMGGEYFLYLSNAYVY